MLLILTNHKHQPAASPWSPHYCRITQTHFAVTFRVVTTFQCLLHSSLNVCRRSASEAFRLVTFVRQDPKNNAVDLAAAGDEVIYYNIYFVRPKVPASPAPSQNIFFLNI